MLEKAHAKAKSTFGSVSPLSESGHFTESRFFVIAPNRKNNHEPTHDLLDAVTKQGFTDWIDEQNGCEGNAELRVQQVEFNQGKD